MLPGRLTDCCTVLLCLFVFTGCTVSRQGIFTDRNDGPPLDSIDVSVITDAIPRRDPITRAGNKTPYTVNGKTYFLLPTAAGYREVGLASWYGTKFHGRPTSNGEIYSLYGMTAAHKTLPIPAYVKVTNLANNLSVIVRVNDRGPFHGDRIIDLSYAAAKKLGYVAQGTARVEVKVVDPLAYQRHSVQTQLIDGQVAAPPVVAALEVQSSKSNAAGQMTQSKVNEHAKPPGMTFLQVGAYASYPSAGKRRVQVSGLTNYPVVIREAGHPVEQKFLFKVLVGPITDPMKLQKLRDRLQAMGGFRPFLVSDLLGGGV